MVVNPELAGVPELIRGMSSTRTPKIVAIRNHNASVRGAVRADATLERPSGWGRSFAERMAGMRAPAGEGRALHPRCVPAVFVIRFNKTQQAPTPLRSRLGKYHGQT